MKDKLRELAFTGFLIILILLVFSLMLLQKPVYLSLDEETIECYENAIQFLAEDANITSNEINVQNVRCSQEGYYSQWELIGTYFENNDHSKDPKPIYFHEIRGGTAASGADSYYEMCLIINNKIRISKIEIGREMIYKSPGRCFWQTQLP